MNSGYSIDDLDLKDKNTVFNNIFKFLLGSVIYHFSLNQDFKKYYTKLSKDIYKLDNFMYSDIFGGKDVCKVYSPLFNGKTIGVCSLCRMDDSNDTIYINTLYLQPDYRYRGYGGKIIERIIHDFPDKNIELDVFKENKQAISLYRSLGFKPIRDYKYDLGEEYNIRSITMRLDKGGLL